MTNKPKTGKVLACKHCGKEVYVPKNRLDTFKYCSRRCSSLDARQQLTSKCQICGKEFEHISSRANKAKYCSRKCYNKAQRLKGSVIVNCQHCGKEIRTSPSKKRKYCSKECVNKPKKECWNPDFTTIRKAMRMRGKIIKCEKCGYDDVVEILGVHHIDRNRKNNSMENLIVLCPNCHSIEHNKHISHCGTIKR